MVNFVGVASAALQLGLESLIVKPKRGIFTNLGPYEPILIPHATIEEHHTDNLEITEHPIQLGSNISDHAFMHPSEITIKMGFSNSPSNSGMINAALGAAAASFPVVNAIGNIAEIGANVQSAITGANPDQVNAIYASLLALQSNRVLVSIFSGRRVYHNMLIRALNVLNDNKSENALFVTVDCRQVIIVNTQSVQLQRANQASKVTVPMSQEGGKSIQTYPNYNAIPL